MQWVVCSWILAWSKIEIKYEKCCCFDFCPRQNCELDGFAFWICHVMGRLRMGTLRITGILCLRYASCVGEEKHKNVVSQFWRLSRTHFISSPNSDRECDVYSYIFLFFASIPKIRNVTSRPEIKNFSWDDVNMYSCWMVSSNQAKGLRFVTKLLRHCSLGTAWKLLEQLFT